jgi:hypothetical protein
MLIVLKLEKVWDFIRDSYIEIKTHGRARPANEISYIQRTMPIEDEPFTEPSMCKTRHG